MSIHVLEPVNNFVKLRDNIWECGWWKLGEDRVQEHIGSQIYFHKKRLEPSFYGGIIRGYRIEQEGPRQGLMVFEFEFQPSCRNIRTDGTGWSMEMKVVAEKAI
ncbi:MAG: hypothetical protein PHN75_16670 [Syntrophales bacterium]|nr:hypothetical protein [Syntrophales bacterium]